MKLLRYISCLFLLLVSLMPAAAQSRSQRVVAILAEFPDTPISITEDYADSLFRVAEQYFRDQIGPDDSITVKRGPSVKLSLSKDGNNVSLAVAEACRMADALTNYGYFDLDKNGDVDCVCVIFSGEKVWPRQYQLNDDNVYLSLDGKNINRYIAVSEYFEEAPLSTGLLCHELGHILDLPDLYDTDGEGSDGVAKALWGSTALMDKGDRNDEGRTPAGFNAIDYHILGLGTCDTLKVGSFKLEPFSRSRRYLWYPADITGEYFIIECRAQEGWDKYIGGEGMLVYHVDRSRNRAGFSTYYNVTLTADERWTRKQINCRPDHQCVDLVEAYSGADTVSAVFFPYTDSQTFASDTDPEFRFWSGRPAQLAIKDIRMEADSSVSFNVIEPIKDGKEYIFQETATICWEFDESLVSEIDSCVVFWEKNGETISHDRLKVSANGKAFQTKNNLESNTQYQIAVILHTNSAVYSSKRTVKTRVTDKRNTIPFIFLSEAERDREGYFVRGCSFPLHVYNAIGAEEIRWTFNEKEPVLNEEGLFTIDRNGVLRAEIFYEDGSCDVITKEILAR